MNKRLLLYGLLIVAWLCVPWHLDAKVYINENFDDITSGLPAGWENKDVSASYQWQSHASGYNNTRCIYFDAWNANEANKATLLTPAFTPEKAGTVISFRFKNKSNQVGNTLKVYVKDAAGTTVLQTLSEELKSASDEWTLIEYYLNDFSGQQIRLAFFYQSDYWTNPGCMLDDVLIEDTPECAAPTGMNATGITQTSAALNWSYTAVGTPSDSYKIKVTNVATGEVVKNNETITAPGQTYDLTGLSATSKYKVELTADCSAALKGESKTATLVFSTLAGPVTLPYMQDFTVASFDELLGWGMFADQPHYVQFYDWEGHNANGVMQVQADNGAVTTVIMPQMAHEFTDVQLSMWLKGNKGVSFTLGVMLDVSDISTFIELGTYQIKESNQWYEFRMNTAAFTDYPGEDYAFAIQLKSDGDYAGFYVDDLTLSAKPTCPRLEDVAVIQNDTSAVTVSYFTYSPDATVEASVLKAGDTDPVITTVTPVVDLANNTAVVDIKNLEPSTDYTISLRSVCSASDKGEWSSPLSVSTPCGVRRDLLFHETFTSEMWELPACWVSESSNHEGNSRWSISEDGENQYVRLGRDWGADTTRVRLVTQAVRIPEAGKYDVSFRMKRTNPQESDRGGWGNEVDSIDGLQVYISNTSSIDGAHKCEFLPVNSNLAPAEKNAGWIEYVFNIDVDGVTYIIFEGVTRAANIQIDDVKIQEAPACRAVRYIGMAEPTATEATISWRSDGSATEWRVDYTLSSVLGSEPKSETVRNNPSLTLNGLTAATRYKVSGTITTVCGAGNTSEPVSFEIVFETECGEKSLPFAEGFDSELFLPDCWSQYFNYKGYQGSVDMLDSAWVRNTDKAYTAAGNASVGMRRVNERTSRASLVTPAIDIPATGKYRLTFWMYRDNRTEYDELRVMSAKDRVAVAGKTDTLGYFRVGRSVAPLESADGMYKYFIDLNTDKLDIRGTRYFIFEGSLQSDKNIWIDEVNVSEIASCDYIHGTLRFDSIRHDAVRIYVDGEKVDSYEVEYGPKGFTPTGRDNLAVLSAKSPVLSGLQADTEYDVYVRRYCDAANQGEWSTRVQSFMTLCSPVDITLDSEFYDGFEDINIDQSIAPCYIHDFPGIAEETEPAYFTGRGADVAAGIYPKFGRRYAGAASGVNTYVLRPMTLRKNHYYEVSAIFVSESVDPANTAVAFVYGRSPEKDASMVTITTAQIGNKWTEVRGYIQNVPADGTYYVGWDVTQSTNARFSGIDEFRVREVTCVPPSKMDVSNITSATAALTWESIGSDWDVKVLTVNDVENTEAVVFEQSGINTKSVGLTGLESNTRYYCFVRTACGGSDNSRWSDPVAFTTVCDAVDVPLTVDFEDAAQADFSCWSLSSTGEAVRDVSVAHTGSASLRASQVSVISPKLNVTSLADYKISAYVYSINPNVEITVGVQTDPNDAGTFEPLITLNVVREKRWTELTCYFKELLDAAYTDFKDAKYIVISVDADNVYIDDIVIEPAAACPQPTEPVITNVGGNDVTIGWKENGSAESWLVEVLQGGVHYFDTVVTTNPATIIGLDPITEYTLNIQARCSDTDLSPKAEAGIFKTGCGAMKVPYAAAINLNDWTVSFPSPFPTCWWQGDNAPETEDAEYPSENNRWMPNTGYGFIIYQYNKVVNAEATLFSPAFDLSDAVNPKLNIQISLAYYDKMSVLVSTDGGTTYDVLNEINSTEEYYSNNFTYDLTPYKSKNVAFGFKVKVNSGAVGKWAEAKLQKFEITVDEACTRPTGFNSYTSTTNSATVNFADTAIAHTAWEVSYGNVGVNPDAGTIKPVSTRSCEIDGLAAKSKYDVYVRAVCGEGLYSYWVGPYSIETQCAATAILPYREAFESYSSVDEMCITFLNQDKDDRYNHYPSAKICSVEETYYVGYVNEGEKALALKSSNNSPLYVVLPKFEADIQNLRVRFSYRNSSEFEGYDAHIALGLVNVATGEFVEYNSYPLSRKFATKSYRFAYVAPEHEDWQIAFRYGGSTQNGYDAALDDIRVEEDLSCPGASRLGATNIATESFDVEYSGISPKVDIAYGLAGTAPDNCTVTTHDNQADNAVSTHTVEGLEPATTYYVFARGRRENGDVSEWSAPLVVTTACAVFELTKENPYFESFDTYEESGNLFPPCFTVLDRYTKDNVEYPVLTSEKRISEPRSLLLKGNTAVALPELSFPLHQTIVSFDVSGTNFRVGLVDDITAENLEIKYFKGGETGGDGEYRGFSASRDEFRHYEFDLTDDTVQGNYIVFATYTNASAFEHEAYIDNIQVKIAPICYEPRKVKITNVLDTAASFEWVAAPAATSFEYKLDKFEIKENNNGGRVMYDTIYTNQTSGTVPEAALDLQQLTPNTNYRLQLRALCEECDDCEETTTRWTNTLFTSLRTLGRIPYDCDFEDDEENISWYRSGEYQGGWNSNTFIIDNDPAAVNKGTKALYVRPNQTSTYGYFAWEPNDSRYPYNNYAYRYFYLEPGNYDIEYDWKQPSPAERSVARMFLVPADVNLEFRDAATANDMVSKPGIVLLDEGEMRNQPEWKHTKVSFTMETAGMYKLAVAWISCDRAKEETECLPVAVDNITMEHHELAAPTDLQLDSVSGSEAWLSWTDTENERFLVQVFDTKHNAVVDTIIDTKAEDAERWSVKVAGLQYATAYEARVRAQVDRYTSKWIELDFISECVINTIPYTENFNAMTEPEVPICWDVTGNWQTLLFNSSNVMNCDASVAAGKAEVVTPAFTIDKAGYHLTYSYYNNTSDAVFTLYASTDGTTFEKLLEDGQTAGFEDRWLNIDAKYTGKNVTFKLVADIKTTAANTRVSFDDFRIVCVDEAVVEHNEHTCSGSAYEEFGFNIPADKIAQGGTYKFERLVKSATADGCDHIERLNLTVGQSYRMEINASTCMGVGYVSEAFPVSDQYPDGLLEAGTYTASLKAEGGCDSLIILNLTVTDFTQTIDTVICEGSVYDFYGQNITETGSYIHEAETEDGCDATVTLNISVQPREYVTSQYFCSGQSYEYKGVTYTESKRFEEPYKSKRGCDSVIVTNFVILPDSTVLDTTICRGQKVIFAGKEYKESGRYTQLYQNVAKCDSLAVLLLTVTEPDTTRLTDVACEGYPYNDNGFYNVTVKRDTVLSRIASTKAGCDSVIEVAVDFIATVYVDTTVTIKDGEVYLFDGNDLVNPGNYTATFETEEHGCDSVVNLTLVVTTGVDNVRDRAVAIAPNPVRKGNMAVVYHDWTAEEQNGLTVELINSVGQIVSAFEPSVYPIAIPAVNVSGVYHIRITTGTGDVYVGKLIVK